MHIQGIFAKTLIPYLWLSITGANNENFNIFVTFCIQDMNMRAPQNRPQHHHQHSDFFGPLNGGGMHSAPSWLTSSGMNDGFFLQDPLSEYNSKVN